MTHCNQCGFVDSALPVDAAVPSLLGLVPEYRTLVQQMGTTHGDAFLARRAAAGSWSVLERVLGVADGFQARARAITAVADGVEDRIQLLRIHAPRAGVNGWHPQIVLAALHSATADLARAAGRFATTEWDDVHVVGGRRVTVRALLYDAVHEGRHTLTELRDAEAFASTTPPVRLPQPA
jgi:hypothetical protein